MKTLLRLSLASLALIGLVCSKTHRTSDQNQPRATTVTDTTSADISGIDQRIRDEMQHRGISRDAAIGHLIRIGITRAIPDPKDPLGLLISDDEFMEAEIQRYMKQHNVSRSEAVQRLLRVAAATDPTNPLGLEPPPTKT